MELLLVITIITIVVSMLLPALSSARDEGRRIACNNHLKQLALCVQMYAADNDGHLPENRPGSRNTNGWIMGSMLLPQEATNSNLLRQGKLFPYVNHVNLYRCPSDRLQTNNALRVRSYSMNGWVGSRYMDSYEAPVRYRTFVRDSELAAARPSGIWLMMDEHEASINDGWFFVTMNDSQPFASFPASRHQRGYCLNFADGHVASQKLRDPESQRFDFSNRHHRFSPNNIDWILLKELTTVR